MKNQPAILTFFFLSLTVFLVSLTLPGQDREDTFCPSGRGVEDLTVYEGEFFVGSGLCVNCHNTSIDGGDQVDADGNDVSTINDWMATMMANSARDPFWKAKVSHEGLVNEDYRNEIENTCTRCHAPQGVYEQQMTTGGEFLMEDLAESELGQDGVACIACHAIDDVPELGDMFNGELIYTEDHLAFGGYDMPWDGLMSGQTGFNPVYSEHVRDSELCASCHSLFTHTFVDGEPTDNTFYEQATYHEWLNSSYPAQETECQTCHMPLVEGGAISASNPLWLFNQEPYARHHLVGGNTYMLGLMNEYREDLDLPATSEQFDMVETRTRDFLQQQTLDLELVKIDLVEDTIQFELNITNKAGHKFPSGYPARLAWVAFRLEDEAGNVIFENGLLDEDYEIVGRDLPYEPHHDIVRESEEVPIYEMVMADANDQPTTVLENAAYPLKDNRLVPLGFSQSHSTYDTTLVAGLALLDENFNAAEGSEGSGSDRVIYRIAVDGYEGELTAEATVYYQSLPPRWMEEMFAFSSDAIDSFKAMYESRDPEAELVATTVLETTTDIREQEAFDILVYPNPSSDGVFRLGLNGSRLTSVEVYEAGGRRVDSAVLPGNRLRLSAGSGAYILVVDTDRGRTIKRVLID